MSKLNSILITVVVILALVFGALIYRLTLRGQNAVNTQVANQPETEEIGREVGVTTERTPFPTIKPIMRAFLQRRQAPFYAEIPAGQEVVLMNQDSELLPLSVTGLVNEAIELKPFEQKSYTPQSAGEIVFKATNGTGIEGRILVK